MMLLGGLRWRKQVRQQDASLNSGDFLLVVSPPWAINPKNLPVSSVEKLAFELIYWLAENIVLGLLWESDN